MSGVIGVSPDMKSGVVGKYPDGHVIQIVRAEYNTNNTDNYTTNIHTRCEAGSDDYNWKGVINNVQASSHVYVTMSFCWYMQKSGPEVGGGFGMFRDTDGAGTGLTEILIAKQHQHLIYSGGGSYNRILYGQYFDMSYMDQSPATGSNHYYLGIIAYSSSVCQIRSTSDYPPFACTMMEIQR